MSAKAGTTSCEASTENDAETTLGEARSHLDRLRIRYTDAQSLLNKRSELGVQIDSTMPDIITVTETRLTQSMDSMELDLEDVTLVGADRIQKRKDGRVALFIRNAIPFAIIDSVSHESGTCELSSCRLKCKGQELLIGLIYRSPSCEVNEVLLSSLNTWSQSGRCLNPSIL